jgi:hypothetical protein
MDINTFVPVSLYLPQNPAISGKEINIILLFEGNREDKVHVQEKSVIVSQFVLSPSPIYSNIVAHKLLRKRQIAEMKSVMLVRKGKRGKFFI